MRLFFFRELREPTVPRTPHFYFGSYKEGRGSGNRRFPEFPDSTQKAEKLILILRSIKYNTKPNNNNIKSTCLPSASSSPACSPSTTRPASRVS